MLGDIVMSIDTLMREAKEQKKSLENHYVHLLCHGVLHLLGFDHIDDDEANEMEFFEIEILRRLKIANPYAGIIFFSTILPILIKQFSFKICLIKPTD